MVPEVTPYAALYVTTTIIAIFVAIIAWDRRSMTGGKSLSMTMVAIAVWALGAALEILAVDVQAKLTWSKIAYLGTLSAPVLFLIFAAEYSRLDKWLTRRNIVLVFIVPLITLGLAFTNEWHGLVWSSMTPSPVVKNMVIYGHGLWFWVGAVGYSYSVIIAATLLLIWAVIRFPKTYHSQSFSLLAGLAVALLGNALYVLRLSPLPGLELTPITFTLTGAIYAHAILRFKLLDLIPVARDVLIDTMRDGVLVLDELHRIVDINPAARRLLGVDVDKEVSAGNPAEGILPIWPAIAGFVDQASESRTEIALSQPARRNLELSVSPLFSRGGKVNGCLIILRDITERKLAEEALTVMNQRLRAQLTEIEALQANLHEQAMRDPLTDLFNRRYLMEALESELTLAQRAGQPISLAMLDVDNFKNLNDSHGHRVADEVLRELATVLRDHTQKRDITCRYGGDEFVVLMPGATLEVAQTLVDHCRAEFAATRISHEGQTLQVTFSAGVATFPEHGMTSDELLRVADGALYRAKNGGRNLVLSAAVVA